MKTVNFYTKGSILILFTLLVVVSCSLLSCNVTRTITNESQYLEKGDTTIVIQTKTIETYDATKR